MPARKVIDVRETQGLLADLLAQVDAGTEVVITDGQRERARLVAIPPPPARRPGLHAGSMTVSADFDAPLGDEFWSGGA